MKRLTTSILCVILAGVLLLSCTSCGLRVSAAELSKGYERTATETGEITEAFKTAMADFSMSLFQGLVTKDSENDLISPLSAVICLAMIANGADGETKAQMETAFGMDINALNQSLYAYTSSLYRADDCKLNLADSIWFRDEENRLHVNEEFLQTNADWYDAQIYSAPFDDSTLTDINHWCKKYTDGMIEKMIDEIDDDTVMYLVNALTFDAKWAKKYEKKDVNEAQFTNYDGSKNTVQMLSSEESVFLSADGVKGFAKNYAGDKYSIVGLLPDEKTDIYDYIASLTGEQWMNLWNGRQTASVSVQMPEFSYSVGMRMNDTLKAMGMTDMFDGNADFSKLGYSENGNIHCSEVCQKTFIQVDRNGTKAAAITWGALKDLACVAELYRVILDRPFIYAIVDNATGLPIFVGAVTAL